MSESVNSEAKALNVKGGHILIETTDDDNVDPNDESRIDEILKELLNDASEETDFDIYQVCVIFTR